MVIYVKINYAEKERGIIMLRFLEGGWFLTVMVGIAALGMLDKLLVRHLYKRLIKQSDHMNETKNKFLKQIRQKFENSYRLNFGVNNISVFIEKQVNQYRFMGFSLQGINNFSGQASGLVILSGILLSLAAYWYKMNFDLIVLYTCVGIVLGIGCYLWDNLIDASGCRQVLLAQLGDYLENNLKNQLLRDVADVEDLDLKAVDDTVKERSVQSKKDIEYLKKSLDQIAAGMSPEPEQEPKQDQSLLKKQLTPQEERVIKDIIKEYLS